MSPHLHVVCAVLRRHMSSLRARLEFSSIFHVVSCHRGQQRNNEIAEEQKLKELIYLFGHPLAGNFKMETSPRKTVSVWIICGTEKYLFSILQRGDLNLLFRADHIF